MRLGSLALMLVVGCGGDKDAPAQPTLDTNTDTTVVVPTGDTSQPPPGPDMVWTPSENYSFDAAWSMATLPEVRAEFDVIINWGAVSTSGWGQAIEPATYDRVVLAEFLMDETEFLDALDNDTLRRQTAISWWELDSPGTVFAKLTDFELDNGTVMDPATFFLESSAKRWVILLATEDDDRLDLHAGIQALVPSDLSQTTQIVLDDASSSLNWSASMPTQPLFTSSGHEVYTVDFDALETTVHGAEWDKTVADELFIGRFDGVAAASDLADQVLDLKSAAVEWYTMDVQNEDETRLDLARDATGGAFAGFTTEGLWLMGIRCTTCFGPAPWAVAVVDVVSGD